MMQFKEYVLIKEMLLREADSNQYDTTYRDILYRRYGKENADKMLEKAKNRQNSNPLQNFEAPNYSDESIDMPLKVNLKQTEKEPNLRGIAPNTEKGFTIFGTKDQPHYKATKKEFENGEYEMPQSTTPIDIVGHEATHQLQFGPDSIPKRLGKSLINKLSPYGKSGKKEETMYKQGVTSMDKFFKSPKETYSDEYRRKLYTWNAHEPASYLNELKLWYYKTYGKIIDADSSKEEIDAFKNNTKDFLLKDKNGVYKNYIDALELLDYPEGQELLKQVVRNKTPNYKNIS